MIFYKNLFEISNNISLYNILDNETIICKLITKGIKFIMIDDDRLKHSYAVARKMVNIGKKMGLKDDKLKELFILGFNHDIGYEYTDNGKGHNKVGGEILKESGFKYWREVYYHGELTSEYSSTYLDILNYADMQIDKYGHDVGFEKRLKDIKSRYGEDSIVFERCKKMIEYLQSKISFFENERDER